MDVTAVSLVIPGRNCSRTIRACLDAAIVILDADESPLKEVIFVDDGSTEDTASIVDSYPVKILQGPGGGPGAARNIGWRAARCPLVWFIDSDCVAQPDALERLLSTMGDQDDRNTDGNVHGSERVVRADHRMAARPPRVGGVGGSYANMSPGSLLACLIHEEIVQRHQRMPREVNFLGGFNVLYLRSVLEEVGGFDECRFNGPGSPGAEDAELSYRVHSAGYRLRFEPESRVGHFHPTQLRRYLRSQRHHGYWRVALHLAYRDKAAGDAYSGAIDHAQPVLAVLCAVTLPAVWSPELKWLCPTIAALLAAAQLPMTLRLVRRTGRPIFLAFAPFGFVRAFWRGFGMLLGFVSYAFLQRP